MNTFYEFFAGGGMARLGLGEKWRCLFSNEIDEKKAAVYRENFRDHITLKVGDVARLSVEDFSSEIADLAWASFPCQDLSLAGVMAGLDGERSGTFWPFWRLMQRLMSQGRAPNLIVLENVYGALTSHEGRDFAAIGNALASAQYYFGALVIDAVRFVPQSRPRLFIIGVHERVGVDNHLVGFGPDPMWHPQAISKGGSILSRAARERWIWWYLPPPAKRNQNFADLIEENPTSVAWHSPEQTDRLLNMMSETNLKKVRAAQAAGAPVIGGVYKRTRNGVQRAEVRFDDVAGCLRTPAGGSSRQIILHIEGKRVRSRLLSAREAARLMGLPDDYKLPEKYNDAYHLAGDGLVIPVVRHLATHLLEPLASSAQALEREAA